MAGVARGRVVILPKHDIFQVGKRSTNISDKIFIFPHLVLSKATYATRMSAAVIFT